MHRIFFILMLVLTVCAPAQAEDRNTINLSAFGAWPVLHDGRVKTMESFARSSFYEISKSVAVDDMNALDWLAESLFDPSQSIGRRIIKIDRPGLLDLPDRNDGYYSLSEVMEAMRPHEDLVMNLERRDPATLTGSQKNLLNVYYALVTYNQVIQAFSAILPINAGDKNFLDGAGADAQRALIAAGGVENILLRFIPTDDPQTPKASVWEIVFADEDHPFIQKLADMARAWQANDAQTFEKLAADIRNDLQAQSDHAWTLALEHYYVMINPVLIAMILYGFGLILLATKKTRRAGIFVLTGGAIIQTLALIVRSLILYRPPTGTLYETLLCASLIVILFGLFVYRYKQTALFLGGCAASALLILITSRFFVEGDSLNVLVAVLNTNFWLSTHVTVIIIGYALCVVAAVSGHLYLMTNRRDIKNLMVPLALVALLFTAIGTLLGGIWADQSWGRFWGWDPKENGALVIVLWLAWVLHGRVSGHFSFAPFAAVLALTNITVALTWFGVNLLGVGLHSYGFIEGIAVGLGAFCVLQIAIVAFLYVRYRRVYAS